jgi:hypothetical protein
MHCKYVYGENGELLFIATISDQITTEGCVEVIDKHDYRYPIVGAVYPRRSDETCRLRILSVTPREPLGREIVGKIEHPGHDDDGRDFSTDVGIFHSSFNMGSPIL